MITHRIAVLRGAASPAGYTTKVDSWYLFGVILLYRRQTVL